MSWVPGAALVAALVLAVVAPAVAAAAPVACGNRVYDKEAVFSFSLTRLRAGEEKGHRFIQYQAHIQAYRKYAPNIAFTWVRGLGTAPNGGVAVGNNDSRDKVGRAIPMPWYAHFRIKVKPGSVLAYRGYLRLVVPIPVPSGRITGFHYNGACTAR